MCIFIYLFIYFMNRCSLEIDTEPLYAHMSLYDIRRRKKMSENFYFDFNSVAGFSNGNEIDTTTRSRTCIFDIDGSESNTGEDLFLVIRLEKPLRGDSDLATSAVLNTPEFSVNVDKVKLFVLIYYETLNIFT